MNNFVLFKPFSSNVASLWLFYRYFPGHYSNDLRSLVPPVQTFTTATGHTTYTGANHPHRFYILFGRRKLQSDGFFPTAFTVWIRHSRQCFRNQYTRVLDIHIIYNCYVHKSNQFSNTRLSVTLESYVVRKGNFRKSLLIDKLWMNKSFFWKKMLNFFFISD